MSNLEEIGKTKTTVYIKPKESIVQSVVRDLFTFGFLAFCIYISADSTWWTFLTGGMFIFGLWSRTASIIGDNARTFDSNDQAINYLKGLDK